VKLFLQLLIFVICFQLEVRVKATESKAPVKAGVLPGGILQNEGDGLVLMKGIAWFNQSGTVQVRTLYGHAKGKFANFWLLYDGEKILVRNIKGSLQFEMRDQSIVEIPEGFQIWVGPIDATAKSTHGVLEPIPLKEHLALWSQVYSGDKKSFLKAAQELKEDWANVVEKSAVFYRTSVERELANIANEKERQALQEQEKRDSKVRLKQEFYQRSFAR